MHAVCSIWLIDRNQSSTTTPGQRGPKSNTVKSTLHSPNQTGASPSDGLMSYPGHSLEKGGVYRDAVGVFYSPSQLGWPV